VILVDTSVWVDHLRRGDDRLVDLLTQTQVMMHPFVLGELACGNLHNRREILTFLGDLPRTPMAENSEVLFFIEKRNLMGRGIGYVDAHLVAAASLARVTLWTRDKALRTLAQELSLDAREDRY
jgi:predicted nucleic acid-binding protein